MASECDIATSLFDSKTHYLDHAYDKALGVLAEVGARPNLRISEQVDILRAEARVHLDRGYPRFAEQCLTRALALPPNTLSEFAILSLNVHRAFVTIVGCGELWHDEKCLLAAQEIAGREGTRLNSEFTELVGQIARVMIVKHINCEKRGNQTKRNILDLIRPYIKAAVQQCRYYDVWQLYSPYTWAEDPEVCRELVECLLRDDNLPIQLRAHFARELFELPVSSKDVQWLVKAEQAFLQRDNKIGGAQVHGIMLRNGIIPTVNLLYELITNLNTFVDANCPRLILATAFHVLGLAAQSGKFSLYTQIQEVLHSVSEIAGMTYERMLLSIQHCAQMNIAAARFGAFMELSQPLFEETRTRGCWTQHFLIGRTISLALLQARRPLEAYTLAQDLLTMCQQNCLEAVSTAIYHLAVTQKDQTFPTMEAKLENWRVTCNSLKVNAAEDTSMNDRIAACEKLCLAGDIQMQIVNAVSTSESKEAAEELLQTIRSVQDVLVGMRDQDQGINALRITCDELMIRLYLWQGVRQPGNIEKEEQAIKICDRIIEDCLRHSMTHLLGFKYQLRSMCHYQCFQKSQTRREQAGNLFSIEKDLQQSVVILEQKGLEEPLLIAQHSLTRLYITAWELGFLDESTPLQQIQTLDEVVSRRRQELSVLGSLTALQQKQRFNSRAEVVDLYKWIVFICIQTANQGMLWVWSQKRKARGLADMLGLGTLVPRSVVKSFNEESEAARLFQELNDLSNSLVVTSPSHKSYIRQRISETELELSKYGSFGDFLSLRDGLVIDLSQSKELAKFDGEITKGGRQVIHVDYVISQTKLFALTLNTSLPDVQSSLSEIPITPQAVQDWIQEHFLDIDTRRNMLRDDDLADSESPLRTLDVLIQHIQPLTKPGDLLVICPTSHLYSLPLHALKIWHEDKNDFTYLIERNPVVYSPSFTVTNLCLAQTNFRSELSERRRVLLGVFDEQTAATKIYRTLGELANLIGGESFVAEQVTKPSFGACIKDASVVMYYGHCQYNVENVLQQALILAPPSEVTLESARNPTSDSTTRSREEHSERAAAIGAETSSQTVRNHQVDPKLAHPIINGKDELMLTSTSSSERDSYLSTEEIFNMQLTTSLMVLVACESAAQVISVGDEPLGLISGLMCAGVSSVIGALWPIPVRAGLVFCDKLGPGLHHSTRDQMIDLAVLLQQTIIGIKDVHETSSLYYWGAFSLHGSWILPKDA